MNRPLNVVVFSLCSLLCSMAALSHSPRARAQQVEQPSGREAPATLPDSLDLIPLTHIAVRGQISGNIAQVEVEQTYENHSQERIEAVYVFPLPQDAAVNEMIMVIGERRIVADLREREAARQAYEQARDQGQTASLLEQERPNIFTMNVANIQPGVPIRVLVRYVDQLPYSDGRYHFHHPTVVGPRFIPGTPVGHEGSGVLPDTDRVPDASRITPAVLPEGVRTPYEVDFTLDLEAGMAIRDLESSSHDLGMDWQSTQQVRITLPAEERQPNQDIVFTYALAEDAPEVGLLTHHDEELGGFFTLMMEPPLTFDPEDVRPKEMVFVLDCSGSMSGYPMETSKEVMRHALRHMNPHDTFRVIRFSDAASGLSPTPLANTPENVSRGLAFVNALSGTGGTHMRAGIQAALAPPPDGERMRIVLFLTDGYIGNESEVLALIDELGGESRLFSLGVGNSVNRFLLDSMADVGRGAVQYVTIGEAVEQVVETFYGRIQNPILTDIEVNWNGLEVSQILPDPIPDVFAGTPILLTGRYSSAGQGTVVVSGMQGTREVEFEVDLDLSETANDRPAIPYIWARRKVDALESQVFYYRSDNLREEIIELALQFNLMTQYTSFVAIEERISADVSDPLRTVGVPVALPEGVSDALIGAQVIGVPEEQEEEASAGYYGRGSGGVAVRTMAARPSMDRARERYVSGGETSSAPEPGVTPDQSPVSGSDEDVAVAPQQPPVQAATPENEGIRVALEIHRNLFRACYEGVLADDPDLEGTIRFVLTIEADGTVDEVRIVENTTGNTVLAECLKEAMENIRFPRQPEGPIEYEHTMSFPL